MGVMSEIAAEREEALNEAQQAYDTAYNAYIDYMDKHDINRRTLAEMDELGRLEGVCAIMHWRLDVEKSRRYRV